MTTNHSVPIYGRCKVVYVASALVLALLHDQSVTTLTCASDIPDDARFVSAFYDPIYRRFGIVLEHPDWDEITEDDLLIVMSGPVVYPQLHATIRRPNEATVASA